MPLIIGPRQRDVYSEAKSPTFNLVQVIAAFKNDKHNTNTQSRALFPLSNMSYYVDSPLTLWILILSFFPEEVQVVYLKIERQTRVNCQVIVVSSIHRQPKPWRG